MIAYLRAVKALLDPLGRPVRLVDATGETSYPYFLVWPSTGAPGLEAPLNENADLSFLIGVTGVGLTYDSAGGLSGDGTGVLGPTKPVPLVVPGRKAWIKWAGLGSSGVDRDVTLSGSNRHPAFEAHIYQVESIPA